MKHRHDCLIIILGMGDLAKRKLIPAIYNLIKNEELANFAVVGASRGKETTAGLIKKSEKHIKDKNPRLLNKLKERFYYQDMDFYSHEDSNRLAKLLSEVEKKHKLSGNRLFYLATLPDHFDEITKKIHAYKMTETEGWSRVVFEKPFGHDLKSARKINECINRVFKEKQVYRIDHYLGKELVENISVIRFTNTFLEPLWNRKYIDHIQIILNESLDIENRGGYYDKYGAVKDVMQNHMMQMLCLSMMESPKYLEQRYIRDEKVKLLKKAKVEKIVTGQYEDYAKEVGVKAYSKTETFAAARLSVNNPRWKGVPVYMITGKRMKRKNTAIYVQFKHAPCLLFKNICNFKSNHLTIQIQPEDGVYMGMNVKIPGSKMVDEAKMEFCHACTFGPNTPEAYENLILDVVHGDQSGFIRDDEIEEAWKIIDRALKKTGEPEKYGAGDMPRSAKRLIEKDGRTWHLMAR